MNASRRTAERWAIRFRLWARRVRLTRKLAYILVGAAIASSLSTFAAMTGTTPFGEGAQVVRFLLVLDAVLLLLLGAVIGSRLVSVWAERRRGMAGSRLHTRLAVLFSIVAVTPAILVAVFAAFYLNFVIQDWFGDRTRTAVEEALVVAQAYLHEHQQTIRGDAFAMANDLNRDAPVLMRRPPLFDQVLTNQASVRNLSEALVVDSGGRSLARSALSFSLEFESLPRRVFEQADKGDVVVAVSQGDSRVRAVVKLNRFIDAYLVVSRFVDPEVLARIDRTARAVAQYQTAERQREGVWATLVMIFSVVALLLLLAAVWIGLNVSTQIARPISALIAAAERVRKGDLTARVTATSARDEIGGLGRAFNRMTSQLEGQQHGLIEANRQLDERRRFTETVLTGVSAGVIGLDQWGSINLPNRSASDLLGEDLNERIGTRLADIMPEIGDLLDSARRRPDRLQQAEIRLNLGGDLRTLLARVGTERRGHDIIGFVVTFDDVTDLLSAQRMAAWADVARRIAHEIKNPLTPIQLSAERLRRKYLDQISSDAETFQMLLETITRQVGDIGRMVDEFSSFARMPRPSLKDENLSECIRQAVFLERNRQQDVMFEVDVPEADVHISFDAHQISRALTNILKNAMESIASNSENRDEEAGKIEVRLTANSGEAPVIEVADNGGGLPDVERERLAEPYVTTRDKGTGLGLAIVKKIMEDHGGDLVLENRPGGGARVLLTFAVPEDSRSGESGAPDNEGADLPANDPESPAREDTGTMVHGA